MSTKYNVIMFAHNEERNVEKSIRSVLTNTDSNLYQFWILINGSTDNTLALAKEIAKKNSSIQIRNIALGDKCNAWNEYMWNIAPEVDHHFFVDSDVEFTENAFVHLSDTLVRSSEAIAIAGLPFSGRHKEFYRSLVIDGVCLYGNLYGVKHEFVELVRSRQFKLPVGLGWIDSLITKAINCNITNQYQPIKGRITHNKKAGYKFNSLKPYLLDDIKLYLNRISRYEMGKLQEIELNKLEFNEYPSNLNAINSKILKDISEGKTKCRRLTKSILLRKLSKQVVD